MKKGGIPKFVIYALLIACCSIPLFFKIPIPNKPSDPSVDFYKTLSALKEGDVVLLGSDWTGSTRGESKGHMKAILRTLMRKNVKFVIWSSADPQSPRAALDVIAEVNAERVANKEEKFQRWTQWVSAGFYPNADVAINAVAQDVRTAFGSRRENDTNGVQQQIFKSPVMQKISWKVVFHFPKRSAASTWPASTAICRSPVTRNSRAMISAVTQTGQW